MNWIQSLPGSLLELILPEFCSICGSVKDTVPWCTPGPLLHGLRAFDGPHLCYDCFTSLRPEGSLTMECDFPLAKGLTVMAAHWTNAELVNLIGCWKYKGVRGLVWPLAELLKPTLNSCPWITEKNKLWLPLPLHGRRQRERGFNQAYLLADQLARTWGGQVLNDLVIRRKFTSQQAKLESGTDRADNLKDAFGWGNTKGPTDIQMINKSSPEAMPRIILVDDLVTSGASTGSIIQFLRSGGYRVDTVVCLGMAVPDAGDTPGY